MKWKEYEEVLVDKETTLNNRPLTYIDEDIHFLVLKPNLLLLGQTPIISNKDPTDIKIKIYERDRSVYKDEMKWHRRDGEMNNLNR